MHHFVGRNQNRNSLSGILKDLSFDTATHIHSYILIACEYVIFYELFIDLLTSLLMLLTKQRMRKDVVLRLRQKSFKHSCGKTNMHGVLRCWRFSSGISSDSYVHTQQ